MIKTFPQLVQEVKANITEVSVQDLADKLATDIVLLDVREPGEFSQGHIAGAVNFPRGVLEAQLPMHPQFKDAESPLEEMNQKDIYLICRSGARSAMAAEAMQRLGFEKIYSVAGGMMEWTNQGLHTEA
jgi:rhodanese-related sulfurtransferase